MNLRTFDLNLLPIFDVLIQEQHLSRASERLAMSQPAVSHALKRLREQFGDELFVRTSSGLKPTPRALQLHGVIQPALFMIQSGCDEQEFDPQVSDQHIHITMNAAIEYLAAPGLIKFLRLTAPNMRMHLLSDQAPEIPRLLKEGRLDFAIDYLGFDDPHFSSIELVEEDLTMICAKQHPVIKKRLSLKQYETLPQITLNPRSGFDYGQGRSRGTPIEQLMGTELPNRNIQMVVSSFVVIPEIVASSDLIAMVPKRLAEQSHIQDKLQCLKIPFNYPKVSIQLIWHQSRESDPAHRWARESMARLRELIGL